MQLNTVFLNWLHHRKITDTVIEKFNIYTQGDLLVIPIYDNDGVFIFNKYRRSPLIDIGAKYTYDKGGKLSLFGANHIKKDSHVLITEGEMDTLVAWSHNIEAISGTGGALSFSPEWIPLLSQNKITLCFDNDPAGGSGMAKVLDMIPEANILFLPDRPGIKDISDFVTNGGNLNELLKTAKHFNGLEDVITDKSERISLWQSTHFHDAYIKNHTRVTPTPSNKDHRMGDKLSRAKQYPINELLKFGYDGKACCPFHMETKGSLHYYKDQNKTWCFGGCGRGYDSIDIYKKLNNCSFKEAVEALQ